MRKLLTRGEAKGQFGDGRLFKKKSGSIAQILKIILPYKEARIVCVDLRKQPSQPQIKQFSCLHT